jgi:hypothetical protein
VLYVAASGRQAESRPARDKEKTRTSGRFLPTQVAASLLCPAEQASPKRQARKDRVGPGFSRVSKKDKPEKTGRVGAAKKDKPEKTGRVGSAEIGGKTGSGRVRVGLTRFFFPFFSAINRSDIGSSKYTAIRDPARCREAHEALYLHREHHDKLRGRWAGGSCNRDM